MGRIVKVQYVVKVRCADPTKGMTPMAWHSRKRYQVPGYGRPTQKNLAAWVAAFNASVLPGGCNDHLGAGCQLVAATIVNQDTGETLASYSKES